MTGQAFVPRGIAAQKDPVARIRRVSGLTRSSVRLTPFAPS